MAFAAFVKMKAKHSIQCLIQSECWLRRRTEVLNSPHNTRETIAQGTRPAESDQQCLDDLTSYSWSPRLLLPFF